MPPPHVGDGGSGGPVRCSDQPWGGGRRQTQDQERREAVLADFRQRRTTERRHDGRYGVGVSDDEDRVARVSRNFCGDGTRVRRRVVGAVNDDWLHMTCCCERRGGLSGAAEFSRDDDVHTRRAERGRQGRGARLSRRCQVGIISGPLRFLGVPDQDHERGRRRLCRRGDRERSQCDQEHCASDAPCAPSHGPGPTAQGPGRTHLPDAPSAPLTVLLFCPPVSTSS